MKRRLLLLNVVLLGVVSLLGWTLRERWQDTKAHEHTVLAAKLPTVATPRLPPAPTAQPVLSDKYIDVAQKMLFAKDRNPTVIPDPEPPKQEKPVPPFPVARGVMIWPGLPAAIILSEASKAEQRSYHVGDTVGEFAIRDITNDYLVLEWDGKTFKKTMAELQEKGAPAAATKAAAAPPPPPPTNVGSSESAAIEAPEPATGPGHEVSENYRACTTTDTSPAGTVVAGFRKNVIRTPMGTGCNWERVQQ